MCIRDSIMSDNLAYLDGRRNTINMVMRQATNNREADDSGPVSYTHLRAHETVLDLVCRLLLEKKKTSQPRTRMRSVQVLTLILSR